MALSIGQLNLQLVGDAKGLQKMLPDMNRMGKEINKLNRAQEAGSSKRVAALTKQETAIRRQLRAVQALNAKIKEGGGDPALIGANTRAMQAFTRQMSKGTLSVTEFSRVNDKMTATLGRSSMAMKKAGASAKAGPVSKLGAAMRNLESASVLAVGPLSGVGARINALGSIASRSAIGVVLFFAAITAGLVILAKMSSAAVRTASAMERIDARLRVATGSSALAAANFKFVSETAKSMGLNVITSAEAFSQLTAATRGTAAAGSVTRKVFEGLSAAAAALRLSNEQVEGAFRAVQQIASKGRVQAEELIGQLAERIPNAIQLAANAFNVTQGELLNLVQQGLVPASEFLDKFGTELKKTFSADAGKNVDSLAGSTEALNNAFTFFNLTFDKTFGVTENYIAILHAATGAVEGLTASMQDAEDGSFGFTSGLNMWAGMLGIVDATKSKAELAADAIVRLENAGKSLGDSVPLSEFVTKGISDIGAITGKLTAELNKAKVGLGFLSDEAQTAAVKYGIFEGNIRKGNEVLQSAIRRLDGVANALAFKTEIDTLFTDVLTDTEKLNIKLKDLANLGQRALLALIGGDISGAKYKEITEAIEKMKVILNPSRPPTFTEHMEKLKNILSGTRTSAEKYTKALADQQVQLAFLATDFKGTKEEADAFRDAIQRSVDALDPNRPKTFIENIKQLEGMYKGTRTAAEKFSIAQAEQTRLLDVLKTTTELTTPELDRLKDALNRATEAMNPDREPTITEHLAKLKSLATETAIPLEALNKKLDGLNQLETALKIHFADDPTALAAALHTIDRAWLKLNADFDKSTAAAGMSKFKEHLRGAEQASIAFGRAMSDLNSKVITAYATLEGPALDATIAKYGKLHKQMLQANDTASQMSGAFGSAFEDAIFSGEKLGDVLKSLLIDLLKIIFRKVVLDSILKSISGGIFGGIIPGFAGGGRTPANKPFIVGEEGPEVMQFGRSGKVTPNHELGRIRGGGQRSQASGGNIITQYITFATEIKDDVRAIVVEMLPQIASATTDALVDETQRKGILQTFG